MNRIHDNMCVYCIYLICIYKYTHINVYIKEKYVRFIYTIFIYIINYILV